MSEDKTTIWITKKTRQSLDGLKEHPRATMEEVLLKLIERMKAEAKD